MAARKIKSKKGIVIEIWESSFRIDGMAKTISLGRPFQDKTLIEFVDAAYEHCFEGAAEDAKNKIVATVTNQVRKYLDM